MSSAIISGAVLNGVLKESDVIFADVNNERLSSLSKLGYEVTGSNREAVENSNAVLLAVRPSQAQEALSSVQDVIGEKPLVSICAGIRISSLQSYLHANAKVIRAMPNLPITVGSGMTALATLEMTDVCQKVETLFGASGETVWVKEEQIDIVTAVSGSGPGYFFRIANVIQEEAIRMGLSEEVAKKLVAQTMLGSAKILQREGSEAKSLADHVATPGGTTQAAFQMMDSCSFDTALSKAMQACRDKAISLGST
jgi:pyrroline-5-carboxylate reductase